jgi:hypothetical protein
VPLLAANSAACPLCHCLPRAVPPSRVLPHAAPPFYFASLSPSREINCLTQRRKARKVALSNASVGVLALYTPAHGAVLLCRERPPWRSGPAARLPNPKHFPEWHIDKRTLIVYNNGRCVPQTQIPQTPTRPALAHQRGTAHCPLPTAHCPLPTAYRLPPTDLCPMPQKPRQFRISRQKTLSGVLYRPKNP